MLITMELNTIAFLENLVQGIKAEIEYAYDENNESTGNFERDADTALSNISGRLKTISDLIKNMKVIETTEEIK